MKKENYESDSGSVSGSDNSGSDGSASGSGGSGSVRIGNGESGISNGESGSDNGEFSASGDGGSDTNGTGTEPVSADNGSSESNSGESRETGSASSSRYSRADRERRRQPIRLGDFGSRTADSADSGSTARADETERDSGFNPIRLGNIGAGRKPKDKVNTNAPTSFKIDKDLVTAFIVSVFQIPALALKQDHWNLSKEESKQVSEALINWLESLPKSQGNKVAQFISENLPTINLCMVLFFVVADRVRTSIAIAQVEKGGRFARAVATAQEQNAGASSTIKTPLDNAFSN